MSKHPIQQLIDAGCTEILEAAGFCQTTSDKWGLVGYCDVYERSPGVARFAEVQLAGMAALEWLARNHRDWYATHGKEGYGIVAIGVCLGAPTLAEAAIDAACAVKEASRG
jgi:hypothetical protein